MDTMRLSCKLTQTQLDEISRLARERRETAKEYKRQIDELQESLNRTASEIRTRTDGY